MGKGRTWFVLLAVGWLGVACEVLQPQMKGTRFAPVDLSDHVNGNLTDGWHPDTNVSPGLSNDLAGLPRGLQQFAGVDFDVRGAVQLTGRSLEGWGGKFPVQVEGISVDRKCRRLHFLHATGWQVPDGTQIGKYVVHFADGEQQEIPIVYGRDVRDWWFWSNEPEETTDSVLAWTGENEASKAADMSLRIYKSTWDNPTPEAEVVSLDYISSRSNCAPFLIAITAEP